MEKETLREMQKRIVKSFLDVLILAQLRKEPKSAFDIIVFIHKRFDLLFSSGTIYSTLHSLDRDGLIQGNFAETARRARVYVLTEKGKKTIEAFAKVNGEIQQFVANFLRGPSDELSP